MIIAFAGPSLPPSARTSLSGVTWAAPAAQGDVFRLAQNQPDALVLIDGYFSWTPAVWHKEILWALDHGIRVYGASSMGALRAAELHSFGMRGVGEIFSAFARGELEDDDEVALVHAGAEDDYRPFSLPMVNIRASLKQAEADGVIGDRTARTWLERAKALFYQERTWTNVMVASGGSAEATRFSSWIEAGNSVDVKRSDALAALALAAAETRTPGAPKAFHFEHTALWDALVERATSQTLSRSEDGSTRVLSQDAMRAALARQGAAIEERAVLRMLVADRKEAADLAIDEAALEAEIVGFRRRLGLEDAARFQAWLDLNDLSARGFLALMYRNALTAAFLDRARTAAAPHLLDEIRTQDLYMSAKTRVAELVDEGRLS